MGYPPPVASFFGGLAKGIGQQILTKEERAHQEKQEERKRTFSIVQAALSSGALEDPNQAFEYLASQGLMGQGGKGKGGKGGKAGQPDPMEAIRNIVTGAARDHSEPPKDYSEAPTQGGGSPSPTGQPIPQGFPRLMTPDEQQARAEAAQGRERQANLADFGEREKIRAKTQSEIEQSKVHRGVVDKQPHQNPDGTWSFHVRNPNDPNEVWGQQPAQPPASQTTREGTFGDFLKRTEQEVGHKLSSAEITAAREKWAKAGVSMTPGERMAMAKELASYRASIGASEPEDVSALSQAVTIGDRTTRYFDLSTITGAKEKNRASQHAIKQGIIPVTAKQAEQLEGAHAANANLTGFFQQIRSKLPPDAQNRPLTAVENKLSQFFQSDEDLAAAVAWDTSVLPMLRALQVSGRITNLEFSTALKARPTLTDTVGTAAKKVGTIQQMLSNSAGAILNRGGGGGPTGGGGGTTPTAINPKDPATRTKARQYLIAHGKVATDATIDALLAKPGIAEALK
jgi:hypothetical protein